MLSLDQTAMASALPNERSGHILRALGPSTSLSAMCTQGAATAGFAWVGGQTPHDPATGALVASFQDVPAEVRRLVPRDMVISDIPNERVSAQTWRAVSNLEEALITLESALDKLVHLRLFLREMRSAPASIKMVEHKLHGCLPATTVVGGLARGTAEDVDVLIDAVATTTNSGIKPEHITLPELRSLTSPFPTMTRAGPFLFTSPVSGVDPQSKQCVRRIDNLKPEERSLTDDTYYRLSDEEAVAEHLMMWRHIRSILATVSVPFENILRTSGWLRMSMQEFAPVTRVRRRMFGTKAARTAATSLPVAALRRDDTLFETSVIALMPQAREGIHAPAYRKEIKLQSHGVGPYYVGAVQAGPLVFCAGEVPIDTTGTVPRVIKNTGDLQDGVRLLQYGRCHAESPIMAQAHYVYCLISEALKAHGANFSDVLHQTIYLTNLRDYPALERIATLHFGVRLPPTSLVSIEGASPSDQVLLEVEVTAAVPEG